MEVIVIPTESATSPPAIYVMTLLAVPPGQHPTRITPSARSVGSCISLHKPHATTGMIVYCATNPITISLGLEKTRLKSSILMVSPMPNMATPKKVEVYLVVHANPSCQKNAITEKQIMIIQQISFLLISYSQSYRYAISFSNPCFS